MGQTLLSFTAGKTPPGPYHLAFDVPENHFREAEGWIRDRVPLLGDGAAATFFSPDWNAHMLYFADPCGNILELIARHTRPHESTGDFGASHLLNVSEVGVAVTDVPGTLEALRNTLGTETYREGSATCSAAGTEDGLLIVVQTGRPWFPTARAAVPLPVRIVARTPRPGTLTLPDGPVQATGVIDREHHP
ncbi:hypothetical protein [Deinococcus sp.]|uniref:hypothetical protein n=1 Tax=Deinococcus sp. TaxID=47478 RepID=UPI003C7E2379